MIAYLKITKNLYKSAQTWYNPARNQLKIHIRQDQRRYESAKYWLGGTLKTEIVLLKEISKLFIKSVATFYRFQRKERKNKRRKK